jgi:hypothetical protein
MTTGPGQPSGSKRVRKKKKITTAEKQFADFILESGLGPVEAARKVFKWRCEPGSSEIQRAKDLRRSERVKDYINSRENQILVEADTDRMFIDPTAVNWDKARNFFLKRLEVIRDDSTMKSSTRFKAIQALEKLADPTSDVFLIQSWITLLWRAYEAHCPCCHETFPLWKIQNQKLEESLDEPINEVAEIYDRRMEIITRAEKRKKPHDSQTPLLVAPERHLVGLGPARTGKSFLLAMLALMAFLIPGVEVWILARIYEDARHEVDYLRRFLNALFYPHLKHVVKESFDSKTGELLMESKWGSSLRVRSAKAKGSITGSELEMALVAEPGWVPDDIFDHLRARMISRLGRIIMLGTPQGFGGMLGRMVNLTGRDAKGRIIRIPPEKRTIESGCPWESSLLKFQMDPRDNPEYVKSELETARSELTDSEYASEFEGLMASAEGSKFPYIQPRHLKGLTRGMMEECVFVLGVDQGPRNFGGCLLAFNGEKIYVVRDYFEQDNQTMKAHMNILRESVPGWIKMMGGDPDMWRLTIFDADPPLTNELTEFEEQGKAWPSDITWRPKNITGKFNQDNWRSDTYEFINSMSGLKDPNLFFCMEECDILHSQLMQVQAMPTIRSKDASNPNNKGWIVSDKFRGDHVLDAFVLAMYTIISGQIVVDEMPGKPKDPWEEQKAAFDYLRMRDEMKDLAGMQTDGVKKESDLFQEHFGRKRSGYSWLGGMRGYYKDES